MYALVARLGAFGSFLFFRLFARVASYACCNDGGKEADTPRAGRSITVRHWTGGRQGTGNEQRAGEQVSGTLKRIRAAECAIGSARVPRNGRAHAKSCVGDLGALAMRKQQDDTEREATIASSTRERLKCNYVTAVPAVGPVCRVMTASGSNESVPVALAGSRRDDGHLHRCSQSQFNGKDHRVRCDAREGSRWAERSEAKPAVCELSVRTFVRTWMVSEVGGCESSVLHPMQLT